MALSDRAAEQQPDDSPRQGGTEIAELSQRGYQLLKENLLSEAEDCFRRILEYEETNNYALVGLGDAARKRRDYRGAVTYYEKCLEHHPDNNYALFGLADCFKSLKYFHRAIKVWERYLQHDDQNVTVLTRVADAYRKVRDFQNSRDLYLRVLEMQKDNAYALIGLGHLHYDFKEYAGALHYWGRMHELHGDSVDIRVLTSMGNCHRKMKTFTEGVPYFEKALGRQPTNFYALFGLADCHRGMGNPERSLEYWNRILERDPSNKVILTRAGDAYRCMEQLELAERYYTKALNIEFDEYAILGLALINKARGNMRQAAESLSGLLRSDSGNPRLYLELAECHLKLGERREALLVLQQLETIGVKGRTITAFYERLKQQL
ncbi:MAG: tetratricopeptide repeat protein [Spirochaetaceae bacterium]|nr:MAG: tetratricopeptide repeat protein [Spirochaetaceae bacterium]